jgi:hypothetical protein
VNEQVRAASSDKVNVAELLAAYEAQHGLAALDWAGMIAPYTACVSRGGGRGRQGSQGFEGRAAAIVSYSVLAHGR